MTQYISLKSCFISPQLLPTDNPTNPLRGIQTRVNFKMTILSYCSRQRTIFLIDFCAYTCPVNRAPSMRPYLSHTFELPNNPFLFEILFLSFLLLTSFLHLECYCSQSFCTKLSHCTCHKTDQFVHSRQKTDRS